MNFACEVINSSILGWPSQTGKTCCSSSGSMDTSIGFGWLSCSLDPVENKISKIVPVRIDPQALIFWNHKNNKNDMDRKLQSNPIRLWCLFNRLYFFGASSLCKRKLPTWLGCSARSPQLSQPHTMPCTAPWIVVSFQWNALNSLEKGKKHHVHQTDVVEIDG